MYSLLHFLFLLGSLLLYSSMGCLYIPASSLWHFPLRGSEVSSVPPKELFSEQTNPTTEKAFSLNQLKQPLEHQASLENSTSIAQPLFTRGIYLANGVSRNKAKLSWFLEEAKKANLNTFVMDIQPKMVPREHVDLVKKAGIFPVARLVVYEGGLKKEKSDPQYIEKICQLIEDAAYQGFAEVQLDYIRYADEPALHRLPLKRKYEEITSILARTRAAADRAGVLLSADLFGRVTLNQNDPIGQKLENFAQYVQTIYPMVYPSHYYGDEFRISHPYETVKEGVSKAKARVPHTRIVAYLQGFSMSVAKANLSLQNYVAAQIRAVIDVGGDGYVIWNPRNEYSASFAAILALKEKQLLTRE